MSTFVLNMRSRQGQQVYEWLLRVISGFSRIRFGALVGLVMAPLSGAFMKQNQNPEIQKR